MDFLTQLWLPIVLSTLAVWVLAALFWTVSPHHGKDRDKIANEGAFIDAIRPLGLKPGSYQFPMCASHKDAQRPEFQALWKEGLSGTLVLFGSPLNMGAKMLASLAVYLAVSVTVAYLAWVALPHAFPERAGFARVMQVTGTAATLGYTFGMLPQGIWFGSKLRAMVTCFADGVVYGLVTGAIFAWLWPR